MRIQQYRRWRKQQQDKGLNILGITEHAQGIPGTCDEIYFHNMRIIPRKMYGIDLMFGSEINIIDHDGTLSMEEKIIEKTFGYPDCGNPSSML